MDSKIHSSCLIWGAALLGMLSFAGTFPVTRALTQQFTPLQIGSGRVLVAGAIGAVILLLTRAPMPAREHWRYLAVASLGVALGFPLLSAAALADLTAASAAVSAGILPLLTALAATLVAGERPGRVFWWGCSGGCAAVIVQALGDAGWHWQARNSLFFAAMLCAALGYAAGARVTRQMPAWQVSCWLVVLAAPINGMLLIALEADAIGELRPTLWGWSGFFYLVIFSQLVGFVCWNYALSRGGIARVGQLQLLQPFATLGLAGLWLGEFLSPLAWTTLILVIASIVFVRYGERLFIPTPIHATEDDR